MYKIILYDTSNFEDFPIGGQLTSIRNFLKYVSNYKKDICSKILLIGITNNSEEVGKITKIKIDNNEFDFYPVLYREKNLDNVKKSLRLEYVKGLLKYLKNIKMDKNTINYIHTPEAIISLKITHIFSKYIIFSHGSYFNMTEGFRFYKNNKIINWLFNRFIIIALKHAKKIFTLDKDSTEKYLRYNKKIINVNNSVIIDESITSRNDIHNPLRLLFVGRLSRVKAIDSIIKAVFKLDYVEFTIVGDGEERKHLENLVNNNNKIKFIGSVPPSKVNEFMKNSDILIMNSILEGKPMTIIEAMSYGLPIITTNVGGISELVNAGIDSEYTNGSEESIILAVNKIKNNYFRYSKNALINSKRFDYKIVNEKILNEVIQI